MAAGLTNEAIAERLCLSVRTVERHLSNVYAKLRVSGKAGRAAAAARSPSATCRPPRDPLAVCVLTADAGSQSCVLAPMRARHACPSVPVVRHTDEGGARDGARR